MTIKVEFNCGDLIEYCYDEAHRLATQLQLNVEFSFNGFECIIVPGGDKDRFLSIFQESKVGDTIFN